MNAQAKDSELEKIFEMLKKKRQEEETGVEVLRWQEKKNASYTQDLRELNQWCGSCNKEGAGACVYWMHPRPRI